MSMQIGQLLAATGVALAGYMADVVGRAHKSQRMALRETVVSVLNDLECAPEDRDTVLDLADAKTATTDNSTAVTDDHAAGGDHGAHAGPTVGNTRTLSSVAELRGVVRRLGTKHRDRIYLKRMEGVGRETGFGQLLETADRVQTAAAKGMDGTILRQASVPEWGAVPWAERVMCLLDSACGVRDRYGNFMTTLAAKAGAEYLAAPLKGLGRISEKLWLRAQESFFPRGDCANVFDVVRGMLVCSMMDALSICLDLFVACDPDLWREINGGDLGGGVTAAQAAGITEEIHVIRVKNRFRNPTSSGWTDLLIKFVRAGSYAEIWGLLCVHTRMGA